MVSIGVNQSLSENDLYEHICLENIKKKYKTAGKCEDKQRYKAMIEKVWSWHLKDVMTTVW